MATSIGGYLIKCLIVSCLTEQSKCDIVLCASIQVTIVQGAGLLLHECE